MDKYEELLQENKRLALFSRKMAEKVTRALDIMMDVESSFSRDERMKKRVTRFIEEK